MDVNDWPRRRFLRVLGGIGATTMGISNLNLVHTQDMTSVCTDACIGVRTLVPSKHQSGIKTKAHTRPAASTTSLVGSTAHFTVYYDLTAPDSLSAAQRLLSNGEADYSAIQSLFAPLNTTCDVTMLLDGGPGNAYHYGCSDSQIFCDYRPFYGDDAAIDAPIFATMAELVEVFSALQAKGWYCGSTNGEALSRVLAARQYPYIDAAGYSIGNLWLDSTRPDYITANKAGSGADADNISNGCGVLFLNWLAYELGYSWQSIVQAGATSLAQTYTNLTGRTDGANRFFNLMQTRFPAGQPSNLTVNNPFPLQGMRLMYIHQDGSPMVLLRHYDGNWSGTPLLTKPGASYSAIGCSAVKNRFFGLTEFHQCGIRNNLLYHQVVRPGETVFAAYAISFANPLTSVACTSDMPGDLIVAVADSTGGAMLRSRWAPDRYDDNATWNSPVNIKSMAGDPGYVTAISCASPANNELHICVATSDGNLWHTIRHPNQAWDQFGYVKGQTGNPGSVVAVACASPNPGELQICVLTSDGRFWHTIRHPDGSWDLFNTRTGFPGMATAVGCTRTSVTGELQVCVVVQNGSLWHAIRHPNGSWDPFGWVEGQVPDSAPVKAVACAQSSIW